MDGSILLVDRDLGLLFWLGRILDQAGYQAFPAKSVRDALALLRELHLTVGVLILNCSLPEAEDLITGLRNSQRYLKVICLNGEQEHYCVRGVDAVCPKPSDFSERSKTDWVESVREVLASSLNFRAQ
jgi:DNA-binding response OmpR family regulator